MVYSVYQRGEFHVDEAMSSALHAREWGVFKDMAANKTYKISKAAMSSGAVVMPVVRCLIDGWSMGCCGGQARLQVGQIFYVLSMIQWVNGLNSAKFALSSPSRRSSSRSNSAVARRLFCGGSMACAAKYNVGELVI